MITTFFCCMPGVKVTLVPFLGRDLVAHAILAHPCMPPLMVNLATGEATELLAAHYAPELWPVISGRDVRMAQL